MADVVRDAAGNGPFGPVKLVDGSIARGFYQPRKMSVFSITASTVAKTLPVDDAGQTYPLVILRARSDIIHFRLGSSSVTVDNTAVNGSGADWSLQNNESLIIPTRGATSIAVQGTGTSGKLDVAGVV